MLSLAATAALGVQGLLPPNLLHREPSLVGGLSEAEFRGRLERFSAFAEPLVRAHGGEWALAPDWSDDSVNALAQRFDSTWVVRVSGGLARRPEMDGDSFSLALCHELGHHLGGFPFAGDRAWAAVEGQADYFAAQMCFPALMSGEGLQAVDLRHWELCGREGWGEERRAICARTLAAGEKLGRLFAAARRIATPELKNPEPLWVQETTPAHPSPQCRLDTFRAGALCPLPNDAQLIPGDLLGQNRNALEAEWESGRVNCHEGQGRLEGVRPRCWFAPRWSYAQAAMVDERVEPQDARGHVLPGDMLRLTASLSRGGADGNPNTLAVGSEPGEWQILAASSGVEVVSSGRTSPLPGGHLVWENAAKLRETALCGSTQTLDLAWRQGEVGIRRRIVIPVGNRVESEGVEHVTESEIPDGHGTLAFSESRSLPGPPLRVMATVEFTHPFPGDLVWTVVTPAGQRLPLANHRLGPPGTQTQLWDVSLEGAPAEGNWTLGVGDTVRGDKGRLTGWRLDFEYGMCEREGKTIAVIPLRPKLP